MNMKKSIAAVSAGAMAISAMATVASANVVYHPANENATSAREQIVLTYDLADYVEAFKPTSVKITTTYEGAEYLIRGLNIDVKNGGKGEAEGGSNAGYTVVLGDVLTGIGTKQYFIQTVELSAWSMDHKNPSMWGDGINGIRNKSKVWYSRASLGKDISDMQNEAAAVEDHDHVRVLVASGADNWSEYAFQVHFEKLANSTSGDFILDEFKASDEVNADHGKATDKVHSYSTWADANEVKNGTKAVKDREGRTVTPIEKKADVDDYVVVAVVESETDPVNAKVEITTTFGNLVDAKTAPDNKTTNYDYTLITKKGAALTAADIKTLTPSTKLYFTGKGFDLDESAAAKFSTTTKVDEKAVKGETVVTSDKEGELVDGKAAAQAYVELFNENNKKATQAYAKAANAAASTTDTTAPTTGGTETETSNWYATPAFADGTAYVTDDTPLDVTFPATVPDAFTGVTATVNPVANTVTVTKNGTTFDCTKGIYTDAAATTPAAGALEQEKTYYVKLTVDDNGVKSVVGSFTTKKEATALTAEMINVDTKTGTVTVKDAAGNAIAATEYDVTVKDKDDKAATTADLTKPGKWTVTVTAKATSTVVKGTAEKVVTPTKEITADAVEVDTTAKAVKVTVGGTVLTENTDYTVEYQSEEGKLSSYPTKDGEYTAVVTGTGNAQNGGYTGTVNKKFKIGAEEVKADDPSTLTDIGAISTVLAEAGEDAKAKDVVYYVVTKASLKDKNGNYSTDILDEKYDQKFAFADYDATATTFTAKDVRTVKADKVDSLVHYDYKDEKYDWQYSFNKFIVTSTFTVNYDDWDNAENYTGSGANAKFVPLHNGIRRTTGFDYAPVYAKDSSGKYVWSYNEETYYGTSSVNYNFPGAYNIVKPLHTTLTKPGDVIKALEARKDGGKHYTSPVTVLNDVIGNNEEVSFEFVSCSKYIRNTNAVHIERGRVVKDQYGNVVKDTNGNTLYVVNIVNPTTGENETRMISGNTLTKSTNDAYFRDNNTTMWDKFYGSVDTKNGGMGKYDWYNPVFGQHLYTNATYGTDNNHTLSTNGTGYPLWGPTADGADQNDLSEYYYASASDWPANALGNYGSYNYGGWNTNLFNGGLVINSNWTMQINDTKHFDWGNNSIIFFWSDLTADVNTHATNFLVAMQLYTPTDWYWDTLNVGVGAAAAENVAQVATTAGLEDEGEEVLDEEEIEEEPEEEPEEEYFEDFEEEEPEEEEFEDFEDFEDFEEPEEEEEEEPEEVEVEVEVKEVPSPKTGNSPIALAVIPVALAAAAIVAKKKND